MQENAVLKKKPTVTAALLTILNFLSCSFEKLSNFFGKKGIICA